MRAELERFPLDRDNWSVGGLFEVSWAAFKPGPVMLSICALLLWWA